jgi:glycogen(starch) synthase
MRVLFWSELFWPYIGGGEIFATKLIAAMQEYGHEFAVLTSHDYLELPDKTHYRGIPIYRLPFREALTSGDIAHLHGLCRKVREIKENFKPDLVHVNAISPSVLFHLCATDAHAAPTLVRMNQEALMKEDTGLNTLTTRTLCAADWVCCVSSAALAQVNRLVPKVSARSSLIYNGVELPAESPTPLCFDRPILLCLGRLVPAKGFDVALKALASLNGRHSDVRLLIAGDGPMRADLESLANKLGLGEWVTFIGWVEPDEVPTLINAATMVVMPSWREGMPTVALQAASMARPVVATRAGGLADIVVHQQTGLLSDKGDSQGFADAIAFLLRNPELASKMGIAGRERARELFGWSRCVNAYNELYRELVAKNFVRSGDNTVA